MSLVDKYHKVNSLLVENDVCVNQNFILPKSLHLCMIRFIDNTSIEGEGEHEKQDLSASSRHRTSDGTPDVRHTPAAGRPALIGNPVPPRPNENVGRPTTIGRPTRPEIRPRQTELKRRMSGDNRTSDNYRTSDAACAQPLGFSPM